MRHFVVPAAAAALFLAVSPAAAAPAQDFQAWLGQAVEHSMSRSFPAALARSHASGVAIVRFSAGPDRRPTEVAIVRGSGNPNVDRAALRTIRSLELPENAPAGPHLAVIQYGSESSLAERSRHEAELQAAVGQARLALRTLDRRERHARAAGTDIARSAFE